MNEHLACPVAIVLVASACVADVGARLMAGMGFHLKPGGKYTDVDGGRGGTYAHDAAGATIAFKGGFLDGQTGRHVKASGFDLSSTVSCEHGSRCPNRPLSLT